MTWLKPAGGPSLYHGGMTTLHFEGRAFQPLPDETVLDALLRAGVATPFSCKGGSCHTCLLQCTEGEIPAAAQRALSDTLRGKGYFLPCRCVATGPMTLRPRQPQDMVTRCLLVEATGHGEGLLRLQFESLGPLPCRPGQSLRLVTGAPPEEEPRLMLTSEPDSPVIEARWTLRPGEPVPEALGPGAEFGTEFEVRGPFHAGHDEIPEMPPPAPDAGLWDELGGPRVRAVLESFYAKVYADALLAPFFQGVTMDRIVGKQYSFLEQCITGRKVYWGENPRNTHHWMVIPHRLFDHRQRLMDETMHEHGLSAAQMRRWNHFEEYFRSDIVKDREWPRRIGGELVWLDGFDTVEIDVGTLCDACGAEVPPGATVTYHRRTGRISCPRCSTAAASVAG